MLAMLAFISAVILVYLGMQYYVAFWLLRSFPGLPVAPQTLRIAVLALALLFPLSIYWLRHGSGAAEWLAYAMYVWTGALLIWLSYAAFSDGVLLLARWAGLAERVRPWAGPAVLALTLLSSAYAYWNASRPPLVHRLEVVLPNLPRELDGFKIAQISDLHLGTTVPPRRLPALVEQVNALAPDLLVLTGDLVDPSSVDEGAIERAGAGFRARLGVLAVLGNHEFYHGLSKSLECFKGCGARLLRGEIVELPGGLQVAGVDDLMAARIPRAEVDALLSRLDPSKPSLFLSHQPLMFDLAAEKKVGLMLSGHTHRGQIFPFGFFVRLQYRYLYGLYRRGASALYVSQGTGQWGPPMRWLTRTEVPLIVLRAP
ncbi:MAG TPA: hypothetical protein DCM05_17015 [Elusimicrobia bacterium]|nr:hypothetical protein [Elusimicrobiota bacterium]